MFCFPRRLEPSNLFLFSVFRVYSGTRVVRYLHEKMYPPQSLVGVVCYLQYFLPRNVYVVGVWHTLTAASKVHHVVLKNRCTFRHCKQRVDETFRFDLT